MSVCLGFDGMFQFQSWEDIQSVSLSRNEIRESSGIDQGEAFFTRHIACSLEPREGLPHAWTIFWVKHLLYMIFERRTSSRVWWSTIDFEAKWLEQRSEWLEQWRRVTNAGLHCKFASICHWFQDPNANPKPIWPITHFSSLNIGNWRNLSSCRHQPSWSGRRPPMVGVTWLWMSNRCRIEVLENISISRWSQTFFQSRTFQDVSGSRTDLGRFEIHQRNQSDTRGAFGPSSV